MFRVLSLQTKCLRFLMFLNKMIFANDAEENTPQATLKALNPINPKPYKPKP